ncbi:hypothetical protein RD110_06460 [Rhodoferax koreense]|uniref:TRAP C4-dicarboxylate transport system permease DctM subunit domain-containing protein n=1 Tax=Rhodoferax koreensis TaxID=1842727 RepID=A0A1P8JT03_9BURK|nr:TRAP transporter large permease subunit [Rhodoferax koreense]APW36879.1 hypothetical protein RD110_06460 [Rhodoferax koreense]
MGAAGLWMLLATALLMAVSGLPAWTVLVGTAMAFAVGGMVLGLWPAQLFFALPLRLLGLLEHDLLQALPLYVLIGALLNRLPLTDILFRVALRLMRRTAAAPYLAGLGLGTLLAPMNGSVGASITMLSRAMGRRLGARGIPAESGAALICTASTVGVVVPPSLVLILLGDAMMRAHTEAVNTAARAALIVNTQDIFLGALRPAAAMLVLFMVATWWRHRGVSPAESAAASTATPTGPASPSRADWAIAVGAVACILALLTGVTLGYLYAVEGAATGALALCGFGLATGTLTRSVGRQVLQDTLAITGALFALLMAATTYTLVLRALGTDVWIGDLLRSLPGGGSAALAAVLGMLVLSAFVLDAFEIIFVIVPIAMPPLLVLVPDAAWVAVLALLVLQMGFLLPPFGYAILMVGHLLPGRLSTRRLSRALAPYLLVQAAVIAAVWCWPALVWQPRSAAVAAEAAPLSEEEVQKLFDQQRLEFDKPPAEATP